MWKGILGTKGFKKGTERKKKKKRKEKNWETLRHHRPKAKIRVEMLKPQPLTTRSQHYLLSFLNIEAARLIRHALLLATRRQRPFMNFIAE
jgi:hypothetical protein